MLREHTWGNTALGAVRIKLVQVERTPARKLRHYQGNRSVSSGLGIIRVEFNPSQETLDRHTCSPNLPVLLGLQLPGPHNDSLAIKALAMLPSPHPESS